MIKVVIFDLDDTLINEQDFAFSAFDECSDYLSKVFNIHKEEIYLNITSLYKKSKEKIFNRILEIYNSTDNGLIERLIDIYRNHYPKIKLNKETEKLLIILRNKGYKIGVITDGYKKSQKNKISSLNLAKYIDKIIITDELGDNGEYWKPHVKSYQLMKEHFNVNYNEMIYIGDNLEKDFKAPLKLGMESILFKNPAGVYDKSIINVDKKIIVINSLIEIEKYLEKS